jgi:hypothetical protein
MDNLLDLMFGASLVLIALVLVSVRRAHIRVEYSVSWFLTAIALLGLSRAHWILNLTSQRLGVYGPLTLLLVICCMFLLMFYRFSMIVSKLRDDNIALAQRVAILEFHIHSLSEERKTAA